MCAYARAHAHVYRHNIDPSRMRLQKGAEVRVTKKDKKSSLQQKVNFGKISDDNLPFHSPSFEERFLIGFCPGGNTFLLFLEERQSSAGNHRVLLRIEMTLFHDFFSSTSASIQRRRLLRFSVDLKPMLFERTTHLKSLAGYSIVDRYLHPLTMNRKRGDSDGYADHGQHTIEPLTKRIKSPLSAITEPKLSNVDHDSVSLHRSASKYLMNGTSLGRRDSLELHTIPEFEPQV